MIGPKRATIDYGVPASRALLAWLGRVQLPDPLLVIGSIGLYVLLEALSFMHESNGLPVTPWNPGLGLMFTLIVARGPMFGWVFFIAALLAEHFVITTSLPWYATLGTAIIISGAYTFVAVIARQSPRFDATHFRSRDVLAIVLSGGAGALIVAIALSAFLLSLGHLEVRSLSTVVPPLIVGDMIGIAVVTPFLLRLRLLPRHGTELASTIAIVELIGFICAIALALWLATRPVFPGVGNLFYMLFLPTVIAAVRYGFDGACSALLIVQLGLIGIVQFHDFELFRFTDYQLRLLVLTLTVLLVGMLVSERHALDEDARRTALRLQEAQAEAARAARLNLVSGMAAALAHELNQPLTAARALTRSAHELIGRPETDHKRVESNLAAAVEQIDHAASVVRQMREFLRRGEPQMAPVDVAGVVRDALALVHAFANARGIALDTDIVGPLPRVLGDSVQLQQVVINLVNNSIDAIGETKRSDGQISVAAQLSPSRREIEIRVRDNGVGIPTEKMTDIFEPLMTSRADGIGLGLSISKSIIQAHHGRIWVSSGGAGATEVSVALPIAT